MDNVFRPVKKGLIYIVVTLFILLTVFAVNQTAQIYALTRDIHPYFGYFTLVLMILIFGLILAVPLLSWLGMRRKPEVPKSVHDPAYEGYLLVLKVRLKSNPHLRKHDYVFNEEEDLLEEIQRALLVLDSEANKVVRSGASSVFITTAISQNGSLDSLFVLSSLGRIIWEIAHIYNQRPGIRELLYLYGNIFATVLMARGVEDMDLLDDQLEPVIASVLGGSLGSLIPGAVYVTNLLVNSISEGSVNALLTLRVGSMAKRYSASITEVDKKLLRRSASLEAIGMLGAIIKDNTQLVINAFGSAAKGATRRIFRGKQDV